MPTYIESLELALEDNCHRVADLCELRVKVAEKFDRKFAALRSIDEMVALELARFQALDVIDAEIELLSRGLKKLMHTLEVMT